MNMKRKWLAAAMALTMTTAFAGCGDTYEVYNYDLSEYIKVGDYIGLTVQDMETEVTDEDIEQYVQMALYNFADSKPKTTAAEYEDVVNIDFVGYMNNVEFEGGSASNFDLVLGSGQFIDGFEDGLVGLKAGDTTTLDLSFPDPYVPNPDFAGKAVQFKVTINSVSEKIPPEYTDAFVKENYQYDSIEAFETALRTSMEEQNQSTWRYNRINQIWTQLMNTSEVLQYPEAELNKRYQEFVNYYTSVAQDQDMNLNEYAASQDMGVKQFEEMITEEAKNGVKEEMILYYIVRTEGIEISKEEYQTGALEYAKYYDLTTVEELEAYFSPTEITQNLLYDKLMEYLADTAVSAT